MKYLIFEFSTLLCYSIQDTRKNKTASLYVFLFKILVKLISVFTKFLSPYRRYMKNIKCIDWHSSLNCLHYGLLMCSILSGNFLKEVLYIDFSRNKPADPLDSLTIWCGYPTACTLKRLRNCSTYKGRCHSITCLSLKALKIVEELLVFSSHWKAKNLDSVYKRG